MTVSPEISVRLVQFVIHIQLLDFDVLTVTFDVSPSTQTGGAVLRFYVCCDRSQMVSFSC